MAFVVYLSVSILLVLSFISVKKTLHLFHLLFAWMVVVFSADMYFVIVSLNLKLFETSQRIDRTLIWILHLHIITPVLVVWALDLMNAAKKKRIKFLVIVLAAAVLFSLEYMLSRLGVIRYTDQWRLWWSGLEAFLLMVMSYLLLAGYRLIAGKEGIE